MIIIIFLTQYYHSFLNDFAVTVFLYLLMLILREYYVKTI